MQNVKNKMKHEHATIGKCSICGSVDNMRPNDHWTSDYTDDELSEIDREERESDRWFQIQYEGEDQ